MIYDLYCNELCHLKRILWNTAALNSWLWTSHQSWRNSKMFQLLRLWCAIFLWRKWFCMIQWRIQTGTWRATRLQHKIQCSKWHALFLAHPIGFLKTNFGEYNLEFFSKKKFVPGHDFYYFPFIRIQTLTLKRISWSWRLTASVLEESTVTVWIWNFTCR